MKIPKKSFVGYTKTLKDSWQAMWAQPISFLPIIYAYAITVVLGLIGFFVALYLFGAGMTITRDNILVFSLYVGILAVAFFCSLMHMLAVNIIISSSIAKRKKITFKQSFEGASSIYWRVIKLFLAKVVLLIPIVAIAGVLSIPALFLEALFIIPIIVGVILMLIYVGVTMFMDPSIEASKHTTWRIVRDNFNIVKKDTKYVYKTLFIVIGINLVISIIVTLMSLVFGEESSTLTITQIILNTIISVWTNLFVYEAFFVRYK